MSDPGPAGNAVELIGISKSFSGVTVLKEVRVTFDGGYGDASALLKSLMHSGVQVVSFGEEE